MPTNKKFCSKKGCDRYVVYRNGIPQSKYCANHYYQSLYKNSSIERTHKKTPKVPKPRTQKQNAIDRTDEWFSKYVRLINGTVYGDTVICECFTCGTFHNIKKMDCGHYIGRGHHSVRWEVNNARPQCTKCNQYQSGKHFEFEQRLIKEIGQGGVDDLKEKRMNYCM